MFVIMSDKNVFTIDSCEPFLPALARHLLEENANNPMSFSDCLILLPNRRSCRTLRRILLDNNDDKALLLPRIRAIGDGDENNIDIVVWDEDLYPPISPMRRLFLLSDYIQKEFLRDTDTAQALSLAEELVQFLDEMQRHEIPIQAVTNIFPDELTEYGQKTLELLQILSHEWPDILAEERKTDIVAYTNKMLELQARKWLETPPDYPIIAAGSTGSLVSTRKLLKTVSELPSGQVILPGLDKDMDDLQWSQIEESHPQFMLKSLIEFIGIKRSHVRDWPISSVININSERKRFVSEVMRPADSISQWSKLKLPKESVEGVKLIQAPGMTEEATIIAMQLRQVAEEKDKTAALVTNNRTLARRVIGILRRWGLDIDDSSGVSLSSTEAGRFYSLVGECLASRITPVSLLSVLKNSFCRCGMAKERLSELASFLDRKVLRGVRIRGGLDGLAQTLVNKHAEAEALIRLLKQKTDKLSLMLNNKQEYLRSILQEHINLVEFLASDDGNDGKNFWSNSESSEALYKCLQDLLLAAGDIKIDPAHYSRLISNVLAEAQYWPENDRHSRLFILSPMEARLQHYDMVILADMNHGSWPAEGRTNWISRQMREGLGLPAPERIYGLMAHDFSSLICMREVILTRAEKNGGSPSVPSQLWLRLETVLSSIGYKNECMHNTDWIERVRLLSNPEKIQVIQRPAPCPPISARPRELPVTQIEKLMTDPYSVYAGKILRLRKLDEIDEDPDAAEFGSKIHEILELFNKKYPKGTLQDLINCGRELFAEYSLRPAILSLWWPRFETIAQWFFIEDSERKRKGAEVFAERKGMVQWQSEGGEFILTAKADRIEIYRDGTTNIVDYKTGALPYEVDVKKGLMPQISLEGWILQNGGFEGVKGTLGNMEFWRVNVGKDLGKMRNIKASVEEAEHGIKNLLRVFDNLSTPYIACPDIKHRPTYNDYEHLERVKEYS